MAERVNMLMSQAVPIGSPPQRRMIPLAAGGVIVLPNRSIDQDFGELVVHRRELASMDRFWKLRTQALAPARAAIQSYDRERRRLLQEQLQDTWLDPDYYREDV